eukprot:NP_493564.1 Uncharacterized protein CELE_K05C4.4 [Caenorhabditis elegans]
MSSRSSRRTIFENLSYLAAQLGCPLIIQDFDLKIKRDVEPPATAAVKRLISFATIPACCLHSKGTGPDAQSAEKSASHAILDKFSVIVSSDFRSHLINCANDNEVKDLIPQVAPFFEQLKVAIAADFMSISELHTFDLTAKAKARGKELMTRVLQNVKESTIGYERNILKKASETESVSSQKSTRNISNSVIFEFEALEMRQDLEKSMKKCFHDWKGVERVTYSKTDEVLRAQLFTSHNFSEKNLAETILKLGFKTITESVIVDKNELKFETLASEIAEVGQYVSTVQDMSVLDVITVNRLLEVRPDTLDVSGFCFNLEIFRSINLEGIKKFTARDHCLNSLRNFPYLPNCTVLGLSNNNIKEFARSFATYFFKRIPTLKRIDDKPEKMAPLALEEHFEDEDNKPSSSTSSSFWRHISYQERSLKQMQPKKT